MNSSVFASRLREAMKASGLKQVDLLRQAEIQGVKLGKSQLSQYVSGKTIPRKSTLNFLAQALDVAADWLNPGQQEGEEPQHPHVDRWPIEEESAPLRQFKKSTKLDNVLYDVRGPVLDEANRMEQAGMHVLKLNIGNPAPFGFRAVDEVVHDMSLQLADCEGYSDSKGLWSARKAIMQYYQLKGLPNVQMEDIYTGNGVSELINICMSALLDDGDEILLPMPDYPLWTACATLAGGHPVHYVCDASLAPDLFCVTFSGLSKSHMIAGYRIGWMALSGNKRIARDYIEGLNMLTNMRLCSNVPAQSIVQTALWGHQSVRNYVVPGGRIYEQRNFVYDRLCEMPGVSVVKPKAAFYIFPKLDKKRFNITDDERFALDLLKDKKVLIVQGSGFNCADTDHFRIVYLPRRRTLGEAMDAIEDFLTYYRQ